MIPPPDELVLGDAGRPPSIARTTSVPPVTPAMIWKASLDERYVDWLPVKPTTAFDRHRHAPRAANPVSLCRLRIRQQMLQENDMLLLLYPVQPEASPYKNVSPIFVREAAETQ